MLVDLAEAERALAQALDALKAHPNTGSTHDKSVEIFTRLEACLKQFSPIPQTVRQQLFDVLVSQKKLLDSNPYALALYQAPTVIECLLEDAELLTGTKQHLLFYSAAIGNHPALLEKCQSQLNELSSAEKENMLALAKDRERIEELLPKTLPSPTPTMTRKQAAHDPQQGLNDGAIRV